MIPLILKLLRDIRLPLAVVCLLLAAFQFLWAKITQRIVVEILPTVLEFVPFDVLLNILFKGPGQLIQALVGGDSIDLSRALDVLTIGYVHPLTQTILCVWAIGRASGAIAGEIDRGTMELLLAQPIARYQLVLAHLAVDLLVIPAFCASMWAGSWLGVWTFGAIAPGSSGARAALRLDPWLLAPGLLNVAALLFAVSGVTMALSARGRFRSRVLALAVLVFLLQFLVNLVAQLWNGIAALRPLTLFFYFQPQQVILQNVWTVDVGTPLGLGGPVQANVLAVLVGVGAAGYALALRSFCTRDLPAPL